MEDPQPVEISLPPDPDAHGRAALLLVESLIHGLTAHGVLSSTEALEIMEIALDAQVAIADDIGRPTPSMRRATSLLSSIVESMKTELPR
jgi:hypothetical protein